MERTRFVMPRFSRKMWTSARAREAWAGRIAGVAETWRQLEWMTVVDGVRACASFWLSQEELAALARVLAGHGLGAEVLLWREQREGEGRNLTYRVAVGSGRNLRRFRKAWKRGDDAAIGGLLGYPACCRAFFHRVFVEEGLVDGVWPMAVGGLANSPVTRLIESGGAAEVNPFGAEVGVRLIPHFACGFDCAGSVELAKGFCDSGRRRGFGESIDAALEILRWPVEWSGLHGIAEIRTPILKISRNTDVTNDKRVVRRAGSSFPEEGARGLGFAMKPAARHYSLNVVGREAGLAVG